MAESLKVLRRRIRSTKNTQQITKAMETVSAAKLRRSQERLTAARPHAVTLKHLVGHLAADEAAQSHPLFQQRDAKHKTLIILTADRGLCGAFNTNIIRQADRWLEGRSPEDCALICLGKKGRDYYRRRKYPILLESAKSTGVPSLAEAREVVGAVMSAFLAAKTDQVDLLYTHFASIIQFVPVIETFLPLRAETVTDKPRDDAESAARVDYLYEPDPATVFAALLPRYIESRLYLAMAESMTAEHSARRMAMNNATKNCSELLDVLTLQRNKARQAAITRELLDIVGGAEALR